MAYLQLIAAGISAVSQYSQGQAAKAQAKRQAGAARATSQRDAGSERKRALLMKSRALAVAAASGAGGEDDPTVNNILADIGTQGEMNALGALYEGSESSAGLMQEGRALAREGKARAVSTVLSTAGSMYGKYS
jgi:hypothetical protein